MGHFTISLPNNRQGDVRWGMVRKIQVKNLLNLFQKRKSAEEERIGYIVKIEPAVENQTEYRLLKTKEGKWLQTGEAGFSVKEEDEISLAIKKAIDEHEKQS